MCGIAGFIRRDGAPANRDLVVAMANAIAHRGPDGDGFHVAGPLAFGHRRLAIIDVSGGAQPMASHDGALVITFNGEIYNYLELREELLARGHRFATRCDTEVVLEGWRAWGAGVVDRLRGMFAFALHDAARAELFLARDRVGEKPLYILDHPRVFAFASELKGLLPLPELERRLNPQAVFDYLTLQYVPDEECIFDGVSKLAPGCTMLVAADGTATRRRYWPGPEFLPKWTDSAEALRERTRELVDESVKMRLMSEVPLGVFLSGGIDSSAVVAFMRRHVTGALKTFSIGFAEAAYDERPHARAIARLFGTEHQEFVVEGDALADLPKVARFFDEPFGDMAALPTYYLAQMTRRHVTVALDGDGGDECFAGYMRHIGRTDRVGESINRLRMLPLAVRRRVLRPAAHALATLLPHSPRAEEVGYLGEIVAANPAAAYTQFLTIFRDYQKRLLLAPEFMARVAERNSMRWMERHFNAPGADDDTDRKLRADFHTYLPGALLPKVDRMTMAHGLEARPPLLDHVLLEHAARLPLSEKMPGRDLKHHFKAALRGILPDEILDRRKQGFSVPAEVWFRGRFESFVRETLLSPEARARGIFNPGAVETLLQRHKEGRQRHGHRLWVLAMFELWAREYRPTG